MTFIFLFQLSIYIVFDGEKEFVQNISLWGVSVIVFRCK